MGKYTQQTNFIHHQLKVRELFAMDERLTVFHVSLYFALFFEWNDNRFKTPFIINRTEIMNGAKIGNANTYTKYLKQLDLFGYIEYRPSYNSNIGSTITMYTFDNGSDKGSGNGCGNGSVNEVLPFNKENKTKETLQRNTKIVKGKSELKFAQAKTSNKNNLFSQGVLQSPDILLSKTSKLIKVVKPSVKAQISFPPLIEEIKFYFLEKESTALEAEKFFNHFESNGWLVGGKTKMKNWQAAARNWILNSVKFQNSTSSLSRGNQSQGHLHVNQDKDYSIPL